MSPVSGYPRGLHACCLQSMLYLRDGGYLSSSRTHTLTASLLTYSAETRTLGYFTLTARWDRHGGPYRVAVTEGGASSYQWPGLCIGT